MINSYQLNNNAQYLYLHSYITFTHLKHRWYNVIKMLKYKCCALVGEYLSHCFKPVAL